jgi:hemoglobin-like flavoprotein
LFHHRNSTLDFTTKVIDLLIVVFRLFTTHPEVVDLFSFSSEVKEQMDKSSGLENQASLLMSMIDYAVGQLGNLPELVPKLKELGARHFVNYHAKPEHFKVKITKHVFSVFCS